MGSFRGLFSGFGCVFSGFGGGFVTTGCGGFRRLGARSMDQDLKRENACSPEVEIDFAGGWSARDRCAPDWVNFQMAIGVHGLCGRVL
jgi:hypothetical protein